jgi:enolase-phosphatase E1
VLDTWIREDRKETPLKTLQGMLWEQGYQQGAFRGHIYDDAAEYL